jgi:hypothetical protein
MQSRRTFNVSFIALGALAWTKNAACEDAEQITVRMRIDDSVRQSIPPIAQQGLTIDVDKSEEARELLARAPPGRAVPILVVVVGAIAVPILIQMIRESLRQIYYGGVLIDMRTEPPTITNDLKLPGNMIFVIDRDGKTKQYSSDQLSPSMLTGLLKAK